ncbi:MAG: hypothetical protein K9G62_08375 [Alphaproteobacteria bacterium]|nr:hypothetical protein [Alphaproteobacteria bacterium]
MSLLAANFNALASNERDATPGPEPSAGPKPPNNVAFDLYTGKDDLKGKKEAVKTELENPVFYDVESCGPSQTPLDCLIRTLREHVKEYGTIDELWLNGHGGKLFMGNGSGDSDKGIHVWDLLPALHYLKEELGMKVTDRIILKGCSTLSNLNNEEIRILRDWAKNDWELVGTVSYNVSGGVLGVGFNVGRYVQFTPEGNVIWDPKLDDPWNPYALISADHSWTDHHIGRTQEEGARLMDEAQAREKAQFEREFQKITSPFVTGPKF